MELHLTLQPVSGLIGVWEGEGFGQYPTIDDFHYREELTFSNIGKPFLTYQQRTWSPDGRPMHVETGYLRVPSADLAEFVLAQPTGHVELAEGSLTTDDGVTLSLLSRLLATATAKRVGSNLRRYEMRGDQLDTSMDMAAVGQPLTRHLTSTLFRKA